MRTCFNACTAFVYLCVAYTLYLCVSVDATMRGCIRKRIKPRIKADVLFLMSPVT